MRRVMILCFLLFFAFSSLAQEDEQSPYEIALERIEAARLNDETRLDLSGLGLSDVPPEIGNLSNLRELALGDNQLSSLPSEFGNLSNLIYIEFSNNEFSTMPAEIGNLSNLLSLNFYDNQLSSLPPEIGNLINLQELFLQHNQLSSLPSEIGNLIDLQILNLLDNQLSSLPSEIGNMGSLCLLDIRENSFTSIPHELAALKRLGTLEDCMIYGGGLDLDAALLDALPEEVANGGTSAVLAYLENDALWHFQRLILGTATSFAIVAAVILAWRKQGGKSKRKNEEKLKH